MKVIKEGSVCFKKGEMIVTEFIVKDGTSEELQKYALWKVPVLWILLRRIFG